jgi:hypothetical protein
MTPTGSPPALSGNSDSGRVPGWPVSVTTPAEVRTATYGNRREDAIAETTPSVAEPGAVAPSNCVDRRVTAFHGSGSGHHRSSRSPPCLLHGDDRGSAPVTVPRRFSRTTDETRLPDFPVSDGRFQMVVAIPLPAERCCPMKKTNTRIENHGVSSLIG